jgi:hypothetical protein
MAREFKETAHTKTDMQKYGDNYDRIFKKNPDITINEFLNTVSDDKDSIQSLVENNPGPRVICEEFGPCDL